MILSSLLLPLLGFLVPSVKALTADECPGYLSNHIESTDYSLATTLSLLGDCGIYGTDIKELFLEVTYETVDRIHVKITDNSAARYEVPSVVLTRPTSQNVSSSSANIKFEYTQNPFSWSIIRTSTNEVLFSTENFTLVYEPQYLRVATSLPENPNIYGLGEHTDPFHLPTENYTRTFWSRDAYGVPNGTNLYGNHPVYFEHRSTGTHGVFLLNSNGIDIKINQTEEGKNYLEYNVVGGVLDFYFLAGSETTPVAVAKQYAEVVGTPAEVPYWGFGFHQCRYGYTDWVNVADVIYNYSLAGIPLETMWTDIDYMYQRWIFTNDPDYFPSDKMKIVVDWLHDHQQYYIVMTDPAVGYQPGQNYSTFDSGEELGLWIKNQPGGAQNYTYQIGIVWPGAAVWPDWFDEKTQPWWTEQYEDFFTEDHGFDIDGGWIDMNEPSGFACPYPCLDPFNATLLVGYPPIRTTPAPPPDTPIFGAATPADLANRTYSKRQLGPEMDKKNYFKRMMEQGLDNALVERDISEMGELVKRIEYGGNGTDGVDVLYPPYNINNAAGPLSALTAWVDSIHSNGLIEYDTHNVFGSMMSFHTQKALAARRPGLRTLVITRSTFAGAGTKVGKWLGDNFSDTWHYQRSIAGQLGMASIYQVPMVGSDVCGYAENTTEPLCARWAMLGAFSPFYRNHNTEGTISQEFYRWPTVAEAAKNAIDMRYRLLDYLYTAFHQQSVDGTPLIGPLWYQFPSDSNTWAIDLQFLFGESVLISPVINETWTYIDSLYLAKEMWYEFGDYHKGTYYPVEGEGKNITLTDISLTEIPVHLKGGSIIPLRVTGANTTTTLRTIDFELVVAPSLSNGTATGSLYVDDGVSLTQEKTTELTFGFDGKTLTMSGSFEYPLGVNLAKVTFLNQSAKKSATVNGATATTSYNSTVKSLDVTIGKEFSQVFKVVLE